MTKINKFLEINTHAYILTAVTRNPGSGGSYTADVNEKNLIIKRFNCLNKIDLICHLIIIRKHRTISISISV